MFEDLKDLLIRPDLFSGFDTSALWADPHVAQQMLLLHLSDDHEAASRPGADIDAMTAWIDRELHLSDKRLVDLGCGPGLYARRFQSAGAHVTGIDLSESSIAYAREHGCPGGEFSVGNYLDADLPSADVFTLIYGDICAIPAEARQALFRKIHKALPKDGALVLDAFPTAQFDMKQEATEMALRLDDGFWAPGDYVGLKATFLYPEQTTVLDRYLIVEASRTRTVYNWLEYMTPARLSTELGEAGFASSEAVDAVSGTPWQNDERPFSLIARKQG